MGVFMFTVLNADQASIDSDNIYMTDMVYRQLQQG